MNLPQTGRPLFLLGLLALAASLVGCAPSSYIVLLDDPEGRPSQVIVTTDSGETILSEAGGALALRSSGARPTNVSAEQIARDFGDTMAAQPPPPRTFVLYFETGGARLTPESEAQLPQILATVSDYPAPDISVTGHTDTVGSPAENERLSLRRANFVADWLEDARVEAIDLTVTSHGQRNLLIPTGDGIDEPRNRRVEVTVR
jgi:outer membrane protein OmpA-like peptidoglycan-associated protein